MSIPHILVLFGFVLSSFGSIAYIRNTLAGRTQPNRVSWILFALTPIAGTYISWSIGADPWSIARVFAAGFFPLLILCASFWNTKSYWKLGTFDYACGLFSLIAFYFWLGADSPRVAILLLVIADLFACIPTIRKAWTNPESETGITFLLGVPIFLLNVPAITVWNIENSAFQIYLLIANTGLAYAVYRKPFALLLGKLSQARA
jgi:hypothetical protein